HYRAPDNGGGPQRSLHECAASVRAIERSEDGGPGGRAALGDCADRPDLTGKTWPARCRIKYTSVLTRRTSMPRQVRAVFVDPAAPGNLAIEPVELRDPDRDEVAVWVTAIS